MSAEKSQKLVLEGKFPEIELKRPPYAHKNSATSFQFATNVLKASRYLNAKTSQIRLPFFSFLGRFQTVWDIDRNDG